MVPCSVNSGMLNYTTFIATFVWEHVIIWVYTFPMWPGWNGEITAGSSQSKGGWWRRMELIEGNKTSRQKVAVFVDAGLKPLIMNIHCRDWQYLETTGAEPPSLSQGSSATVKTRPLVSKYWYCTRRMSRTLSWLRKNKLKCHFQWLHI